MLGAVSRNVWALCRMGNVARLRELFAEDPKLARTTDDRASPFFALPEDEDRAFEIAELLLASGADPRVACSLPPQVRGTRSRAPCESTRAAPM